MFFSLKLGHALHNGLCSGKIVIYLLEPFVPFLPRLEQVNGIF